MGTANDWVVVGIDNGGTSNNATVLDPTQGFLVDRLVETLKAAATEQGVKLGDLMQPVRVALTGSTVSEPVNELLVVVGREESLRRLS